MNFDELVQALIELEYRYQEWVAPITQSRKEGWQRIQRGQSTSKEVEYETELVYWQQLKNYNPLQAEAPVRDALLWFYEHATSLERGQIRYFVRKHLYVSRMLLHYIHTCAECLESPDDSWILRSGLIAGAIENSTFDFRDTDLALAKLGVAGLEAQIDIQGIADTVLPLCAPSEPGVMSSSGRIEKFYELAILHFNRRWD